MSIFVSIISYRDPELKETVRQLIDNAAHPEDLHFGIVSQDVNSKHPNFTHMPNVNHVKLHWSKSQGAGWARKIAMELYDGEDYFFQTDSHMMFEPNWDVDLINMLKQAQEIAGTEKVILSQYPAPYFMDSQNTPRKIHGDKDFWDVPSWSSVVLTWAGVWAGNRERMENFSKPHKSYTVLGALMFASGNLPIEIPYDERISFMGEELCFAIRAYTRGWEIYAPNKIVAWHHYKRQNQPKVWADNTQTRQWSEIEFASQSVQRDVLLGIERGVYGIADEQRYMEYQDMIGIQFSDYYGTNKMDEAVNLSLISEEIMPWIPSKKLSGFCSKEIHLRCIGCDCECHKET